LPDWCSGLPAGISNVSARRSRHRYRPSTTQSAWIAQRAPGLTYLVADSTGRRRKNPKNLAKSAGKLAKAQRRLAQCKKGSRRRRKSVRVVARHHERIANQRQDALHKISREYVDAYQMIAIEDLRPGNMAKNHALARAISDAAWGRLRRILAHKAAEAGRQLVAVPPHYTSQRCSACGTHVRKSLSVRTHVCPHCGYVADRDVNAAENILKVAQATLARTGPSPTGGEGLNSDVQ
jgi:putative transposase